ncbi:hypothetical protein SAY86_021312 [Trapa natans]|uniref:Uncharacterized protein n=1 Tax=Trapa natans TaxID=22666 RepID=A0AAN7RFJ4_TRANT|nr:hypothetical protein SAY86_021312 [Trapa natans]
MYFQRYWEWQCLESDSYEETKYEHFLVPFFQSYYIFISIYEIGILVRVLMLKSISWGFADAYYLSKVAGSHQVALLPLGDTLAQHIVGSLYFDGIFACFPVHHSLVFTSLFP